jgi:hypothetical protein
VGCLHVPRPGAQRRQPLGTSTTTHLVLLVVLFQLLVELLELLPLVLQLLGHLDGLAVHVMDVGLRGRVGRGAGW